MSADKFASHKLTLVLLYAFMEWVLILMLLIHSIFTYLIVKFADYFGLKKPCLWCSRFEPLFGRSDACNRDLVCDHHASEISRLGYCSAHRKLVVDSQNLCPDCSHSKTIVFGFPIKEDNFRENGSSARCSCCAAEIDSRFWAPLLKEKEPISQSSWYADDSCIDEKEILEGTRRDDISASHNMIHQLSYNYAEASFRDLVDSGSLKLNADNKSTQLIRDLYSDETVVEFSFTEDESAEVEKDCDFSVAESGDGYGVIGYTDHDGLTWGVEPFALSQTEPLIDDSCCLGHDKSSCAVSPGRSNEQSEVTLVKHTKVNDNECYSIAYTSEGDLVMDLCRNLASTKSNLTGSGSLDTVRQIQGAVEQERDELSHLGSQNVEKTERRVELGTEDQAHEQSNGIPTQSGIPYKTIEFVHEQVTHPVFLFPPPWTEELVCEQTEETLTPASIDHPSDQTDERVVEVVPHVSPNLPLSEVEALSQMQVERDREQAPPLTLPISAEDHSVNPLDFSQIDDHGSDQVETIMALHEVKSVEATEHTLTISLGLTKNEEDKLPDTPFFIDGAQNLYKSWLLLEKKESATEESLDGSIISDHDCGEGILTVDKLRTALRIERKALHALYAELEEERNASAVAASQTMAMINRLQEEKASVQMEALQYQRMMEEQSEYDQEALQLLNELMIKKEKEKQELKKELEIYRKMAIYNEKTDRLMMPNRKEESFRSGSSSVSSSNDENSDGVSVDLKHNMKNMKEFEGKEENGTHNTPLDDVLNVEESLSHFEEERLSILEQLKVLEEKLSTLDDGFSCNPDYSSNMNGIENGFHNNMKGDHHQERRIMVPKAKMLLPLFDATVEVEGNKYGGMIGNENVHDFASYPHSSSSNSEPEIKNISIEEEVDHVYERLQALEADREFLRHCFSSLKKGDKGLELLQEILQHLRNLRSVELEVRK
ncbi:hypothetical protein QQ045_020677 [Rhodiola kirilowii]